MKKSKLSLGLVASFIGALALTACDESTSAVTKSKESIVDFLGYNSKKDRLEINVDELYREYGESKEGTTLYYNAILETLIRYEYEYIAKDEDNEKMLKSLDTIKREANDKVKAVQQTAKDNAKANGTEYDEEWDKILKSNNVKSKKELKQKFIYELEKEELEDWYFKKHSDNLQEQYLGIDKDWGEVTQETENVDPVYPYHILHILVKLDADATNYTRATITEAEAKKLWNVVLKLMDGQFTFEEAAKLSDDTSKDDFGDVGLMTTHTDFYNEFKLGVYAFDGLLSGLNKESDAGSAPLYKAFGIDSEAEVVTKTENNAGVIKETKEKVTDLVENTMYANTIQSHIEGAGATIPTIPFDVFRLINKYAEDEKVGTFEPEGSSASLPRNVLFNAFLNFRSPFVITNETLDESTVSFGDDAIKASEYNFNDASVLKLESNNFKADKVTGLGKKVLCDSTGNVIIGVRSTAGIHFMVMRKSVFQKTNAAVGKAGTSLEDYYTTKVPSDEDFPASGETYVNMKKSNDVSYYTGRADTIKNDIKSASTFDAAYDYRIFETLLNYEIKGTKMENKITFSDEDENGNSVIKNNIDAMIALLRESHHYSQEDSINSAWKSYLLQLSYQNLLRSDAGMYKGAFVPTTCAFRFNKDNTDLEKDFKEGGKCYVK